MRAIVHIGTEKTGTSSIQHFLRTNRKVLQGHGYHFLQSAGETNNWALPAYCTEQSRFGEFHHFKEMESGLPSETFKRDFMINFEKEMRSLGKHIHTVIISSEHFHSRLRSEQEVDNFRKLMANFFQETDIFCYLREQAETCTSWYSTSMKSGNTYSFFDFVRRCRPESYYFNYAKVLKNWEQHFGLNAVKVALFAREELLNGDLLDDFTSRIDLQLVGKLTKSMHNVNESLRPMGQALCRALNMTLPLSDRNQSVNELRDRCKEIIIHRMTGKGQEIEFATRQVIYENFRESNEELRIKYFPERDFLFPPPVDTAEEKIVMERDFHILVSDIFGALDSDAVRPMTSDQYTRYWTAITRCVRDVIDVPDAIRQGGVEVVLTAEDAHALRHAAYRAEWEALPDAERLLTIARSVSPKLAGINAQLQDYRDRLQAEEATTD